MTLHPRDRTVSIVCPGGASRRVGLLAQREQWALSQYAADGAAGRDDQAAPGPGASTLLSCTFTLPLSRGRTVTEVPRALPDLCLLCTLVLGPVPR